MIVHKVLKAMFSVLLVASALGCSGCGSETGTLPGASESTLLERAKTRELENDPEAARDLLKKALEINPKLATAHLDLALIYDDTEKRYVEAIYHYQRYVELRPDTEKMDMIINRIRQARIDFAGSITAPVAETPAFIEKLRKQNAQLEDSVELLNAKIATLELERDAVHAQIVRAVPDEPVELNEAQGPRYYVVRRRDTLQTIARQFYGDKEKWQLIFNANRDVLRNANALQIGQKLRIPPGG